MILEKKTFIISRIFNLVEYLIYRVYPIRFTQLNKRKKHS